MGLDCHLVLRNSRALADADPGLVGNLLVERLVGAHVHQVTKEEYARLGGVALGELLAAQLRAEGRNPYVIPVGGSSPLGCWGYVEAVRELKAQIEGQGFTDIAMVRRWRRGPDSWGAALLLLLLLPCRRRPKSTPPGVRQRGHLRWPGAGGAPGGPGPARACLWGVRRRDVLLRFF